MMDLTSIPMGKVPLWMILLALWSLPWKGVALWKSARNKQMYWFIAMLILNTAAILEIIYIFFFAEKTAKAKKK